MRLLRTRRTDRSNTAPRPPSALRASRQPTQTTELARIQRGLLVRQREGFARDAGRRNHAAVQSARAQHERHPSTLTASYRIGHPYSRGIVDDGSDEAVASCGRLIRATAEIENRAAAQPCSGLWPQALSSPSVCRDEGSGNAPHGGRCGCMKGLGPGGVPAPGPAPLRGDNSKRDASRKFSHLRDSV